MASKKKKTHKPQQLNKFQEKLKGLGNPKNLNKDQLVQLAQGFSVKYALTLEETILEQHKDKITLRNTVEFQQKIIDENKKGIGILVDKYEDRIEELEKDIETLTKQRNESTRAYNGLAQMGKFAEGMGIDLQSAQEDLPEAEKNKYNFKQTDTVLESGKVNTEMKLTLKKKDN